MGGDYKPILLRLNVETLRRLDYLCKTKYKCSRCELLRIAIRAFLQDEGWW